MADCEPTRWRCPFLRPAKVLPGVQRLSKFRRNSTTIQQHVVKILEKRDLRPVERSIFCRSHQEFSNEHLGLKNASIEPRTSPVKVCSLSVYRSPRSTLRGVALGAASPDRFRRGGSAPPRRHRPPRAVPASWSWRDARRLRRSGRRSRAEPRRPSDRLFLSLLHGSRTVSPA